MSENFRIVGPTTLKNYEALADEIAPRAWDEFMLHDPIADKNWNDLFERFSDFQFGIWDEETGRLAAMGNSVPFKWDAPVEELPEGGAPLRFTWARLPMAYRRGPLHRLRVLTDAGWRDCPAGSFDPRGVQAVEAEIPLHGA